MQADIQRKNGTPFLAQRGEGGSEANAEAAAQQQGRLTTNSPEMGPGTKRDCYSVKL
jgi:hypothetical protein